MRLLLDSSLFIGWGRQKQSPTRILRPYLDRSELVTCGIVRAEVLRGAMPPGGRLELVKLFNLMRVIPIDYRLWERTTTLAWSMDRRGKPLPLTDLIISACALSVKAAVVTPDGHFREIPGLTVYPDLP